MLAYSLPSFIASRRDDTGRRCGATRAVTGRGPLGFGCFSFGFLRRCAIWMTASRDMDVGVAMAWRRHCQPHDHPVPAVLLPREPSPERCAPPPVHRTRGGPGGAPPASRRRECRRPAGTPPTLLVSINISTSCRFCRAPAAGSYAKAGSTPTRPSVDGAARDHPIGEPVKFHPNFRISFLVPKHICMGAVIILWRMLDC